MVKRLIGCMRLIIGNYMRAINIDIGWAMLAAAIVQSGEQTNDKSFLESDWHDVLRDTVACFLDMKGSKDAPSMFVSKDHTHRQS